MSAAAVLPVTWVKAPQRLDGLSALSLQDERIWHRINQATQIHTRGGRISVPELARYAECSERTVYRSLRRLKDAGYVYALGAPGKACVYYLHWGYAAPRSAATPTPDTAVRSATPTLAAVTTPTPDTGDRGRINNARASGKTTTQTSAVVGVREHVKPDDAGIPNRVEVLEQAVSPEAGEAIMPHVAYQLAREYPLERIQAGIEWAYGTAVKWRGSRPPRLAGLIVTGVRYGYAPDPLREQPMPARPDLFDVPADVGGWETTLLLSGPFLSFLGGQSTTRQCAKCRGLIEEFESGQVSWCRCGASSETKPSKSV